MNREILILDGNEKSQIKTTSDGSFMMFGETFGQNESKEQVFQVEMLKDPAFKKYFEEVSSIGLIKVDEGGE